MTVREISERTTLVVTRSAGLGVREQPDGLGGL